MNRTYDPYADIRPGPGIYKEVDPRQMPEINRTLGPQEPGVVQAMNRLERAITALDDAMSRLGAQLEPVRCQRPQTPSGQVGEDSPGGSPLCVSLTSLATRLEMMRIYAMNLGHELEI